MTDPPERDDQLAVRNIQQLERSPLDGAVADGIAALGNMPQEEFDQKLAALKTGQQRIAQIKRELMVENVHYGKIPGTGDKPTLLQPGAQLLCHLFGLRATFDQEIEYGDQIETPGCRVVTLCSLHLGDTDGPIVATGRGSANTWERKHRYRRGERTCPNCGTIGAVIKGKANFGGGWICWRGKGGCGAKWPDGTDAIEKQAVSDVENVDQADLENTVIKVSEKRAFNGATLRGTASSDLFTQETVAEDTGPGDGPTPPPEPVKQPAAKSGAKPPGETGPTVGDLNEVMGMLNGGEHISEPQLKRLYAIARGAGWDQAGVDNTIGKAISINTVNIPKLGDAYPAIVAWFQNNPAPA